MDAGAFGARLGPSEAYRFARGEEVVSSTSQRVKLSRPLDFLVVADHSDNMGFFPRLFAGDPAMLANPTGLRWYDMVQKGGPDAVKVALEIIDSFSKGTFPKALLSLPGTPIHTALGGTRAALCHRQHGDTLGNSTCRGILKNQKGANHNEHTKHL